MRIIKSEGYNRKIKVSQTQTIPFPDFACTVTVMPYSNKGPLFIVKTNDGQEKRCYLDLLTGNWKPLS
jgi:hypothetical protein